MLRAFKPASTSSGNFLARVMPFVVMATWVEKGRAISIEFCLVESFCTEFRLIDLNLSNFALSSYRTSSRLSRLIEYHLIEFRLVDLILSNFVLSNFA